MKINIDPSLKSGNKHWIDQRITSILMLLTAPFVINILFNCLNYDISTTMQMIKLHKNITAIVIFLVAAIYHATIGMQIVIEDYIANIALRGVMILTLKITSFVTVVSIVFALIHILIF